MPAELLLFEQLGEAASRTLLAGWCGPLVPEAPGPGHDHRKHTLTWTDCTSPETLEGYVLTFTMSTFSYGQELVFESGAPHGEPVQASRRVQDWPTAWRWIRGGGLDLSRPEVWGRACEMLARAYGAKVQLGDGFTLRWERSRDAWVLEAHEPREDFFRASWDIKGAGWGAAKGGVVGVLPEGREHAPAALCALLLAAKDRIAALAVEAAHAIR